MDNIIIGAKTKWIRLVKINILHDVKLSSNINDS